MTWDPRRYLRFTDHRLRPGVELLARIDLEDPTTVVDLGCGPGNLTRLITERWPAAAVTGIDSSESMLARASQDQPGVDWVSADLTEWSPSGPVDVLFSNAALHWVGDHATVFPRLASWVAPGGVLAVQMPDNWKEPTHTIPAQILDSGAWPAVAVEALVRNPVHSPAFYRNLLRDQSVTIDIWVTTYHQVLASDNPIFEWVEGTVLSPVLTELDQDERREFRRQCTDAYERAYPHEPDGRVVLPFRRLFIVATRTEDSV